MKTIGSNIQYYRKKKGLTEDSLARYLSVSKDLIVSWENGEREPSEENIEKLSSFLRVRIEELTDVSTEKKEKAIPVYSYQSKGKYLGICARCGKTIYSNLHYGMGKVIVGKKETTKFYFDPNDNSGDTYFCSDCCKQLMALQKEEKINEYENEKIRIKKAGGLAIFAGFIAMLLTVAGALVIYFLLHNLLLTYLVGFSSLLTSYCVFSFTYTFALRKNWLHDLICSYCKSSYVILFKKISENDAQDVLKTGFVKAAVMAFIYVVSSLILIVLIFVLALVSMFIWPSAKKAALKALEEIE